MSWSLALRNGDLSLGKASYGTVTSEQKLVQDLRAYILEQMGTDDMHPEFGSLINGGRTPTGEAVSGTVGKMDSDLVQMEIESELRRIINAYKSRQLARAKDDKVTYGKVTLTRGEVLLGVSKIEFKRNLDSLNIVLTLTTANNTSPSLDLLLTN